MEDSPACRFRVLIIGGGIGGLACAIALRKSGHETIVLEGAPDVQQFGAAILVPPNASRAFDTLGVFDRVLRHAVIPKSVVIRAYDSREILSQQRLENLMTELYGYPFMILHRADLHIALYTEAKRIGVIIHFSHPVVALNANQPSAVTANGAVWKADMIIGADGENSICRRVVTGHPIDSRDSGDHIFRTMVPHSRIMADEELVKPIDVSSLNFILGPHGHAVTCSVKRDDMLNVYLVKEHHHKEEPPVPMHPVGLEEPKEEFEGWEISLKLLDVSERCARWTLRNTSTPEQWLKGKLLLVGDAAHPMPPPLGQGAAMCLEDAVVLSILIDSVSKTPDTVSSRDAKIEQVFNSFYEIRSPRTTCLRDKALAMRKIFATPPGPSQHSRDESLKKDLAAIRSGKVDEAGRPKDNIGHNFAENSANIFQDVAFRDMWFGYDARSAATEFAAKRL